MSDFTQQQQEQQQEQQQVNEIHNMFIKINEYIMDISRSTKTTLSSKVSDPGEEIRELGEIINKIQASYRLVYSTENKIAAALKEHNMINIEGIRDDAQDKIDNINSIWENPVFTGRIEQTIDSGHN